jgi:hypothetical protein
MQQKNRPDEKTATDWRTHPLDRELGELLREIEDEPIPERLLDLARKLQTELARRRRKS